MTAQRRKKASGRLLKLYQHKLVNRARYPGEPYIYFIRGGKYSHKINHYLAITDVLLQIRPLVPAGSKLTYDGEVNQGDVITDLAVYYSNQFRGERLTYWFEIELDSTGDIVEKVRKYEDLDLEGSLVIAYKHPRTAAKVEQEKFGIPVQCIPLGEVGAQFKIGSRSFK